MSQQYLVISKENEQVAFCIIKKAIDQYISDKSRYEPDLDKLPDDFKEKRGVFVTLYLRDSEGNENLRGCIGLPRAVYPLGIAIAHATHASLMNDPRFLPVKEEELDEMTIELEILSEMQRIEYDSLENLLEQIEVGKDGLMVESPPYSGLLLPVVPTKYGWDAKDFVYALAQKAGMPFDLIMADNTRIFKFQAQVFKRSYEDLLETC